MILAKSSASLLTLLAVISLQELQLLLAAPAIENAAFTTQDLWADESVPAKWAAVPPPAPLSRLRRYNFDYPGEGSHFGSHHSHHHGHHDHHGFGHGYGHGHGHHAGCNHPVGFGYETFYEFGDFPNHNQPTRPYKAPLAPFGDNPKGNRATATPAATATPSATPTATPTVAATPTTASSTEDSTLAIDLRIGS